MAKKTRFGALLKRYRLAAELTQEALAELAGLSVRAISDLERGVNQSPHHTTFSLLVNALALSPQQYDLLKASLQPEYDNLPEENEPQRKSDFPFPTTRMIGRETERFQALNLIRGEHTRLLTLTGPSGVGKTRLALKLAQDLTSDFSDGIVYVPLATINDATLVPNTIAQNLGIRESTSTSVQRQVKDQLKEKHLMLVLDNLEQILDCTPFLSDLLASCPRLLMLATSRSSLRIRGEHELLLAPLSLEDAVTLFCERARMPQPGRDFSTDEVAPICEQLDCLPLALELAATHTRLLSIPELKRRLTHRFALLRNGARDLPARQQTIEDAIAWSYDLLPPQQQHFFRFLGVFSGGWTLEAAEVVCWAKVEKNDNVVDDIIDDTNWEDRLHHLAALVEASLVQTETDSNGIIRFYLLELIREYALKRLLESGETKLAQQQHANYYAHLAETAETMFESGPAEPNLSLLKEQSNAQAALRWAEANQEAELGLRLIGFGQLWHMLGQPNLALYWFKRMLALDTEVRMQGSPAAPLSLRIKRLYGLGRIMIGCGQMDDAQVVATEALDLAEQAGDENGLTNAWATLGMIAQANGNLGEADKAFQQSSLHARMVRDPNLKFRAIFWQAEIALIRCELAQAATLFEEALSAAQDNNADWDIAIITTMTAHLARDMYNITLAKERYRESLRYLQEFHSPTYIAWNLEGCAALLSFSGHYSEAVVLYATASKLRERAGTPLPDNERENLERIVAKTKRIMGQSAFQNGWSIGTSFTQDEAVTFALSLLD